MTSGSDGPGNRGGWWHTKFLGSLFPSLMNPLTKVALIVDAVSGSYFPSGPIGNRSL